MSTWKNKLIAIFAIAILTIVFVVYAADDDEIDLNQLSQSNPFAQFAGSGAPVPAAAAPAPTTPKPDLFVATKTVKFLDADSLKNTISNMSGDWGSIETDSKTNSLIICDSNENVEKILTQIKRVDRRPDQIMIEVVILDVKLDDNSDIGINWDFVSENLHDAIFRQNFSSTRIGSTLADSDNIGNATAWNTTGTGSSLNLLFGDIRAVIQMIETRNDVEIIASPKVLVLSGETASVESVEEIPYDETSNTSEGGSLTSTSFKNVGVVLNVGATLTDDGLILLNIESEQSVDTGTNGSTTSSTVPIVDSRKVVSSLILEDGQTVAFGGLRKKETKDLVRQLPFFGDLPVVGAAFKKTNTVENESELVVMISPHIYKGQGLTAAQQRKYDEITKRPQLEFPDRNEQKKNEPPKTGWLF